MSDQPIQPSLFEGLEPKGEIQDQKHLAKFTEIQYQLSGMVWGEYMAELMAAGWSWRKAAFVAWSICPPNLRAPDTKNGFALLVGVNRATVSKWASDPNLQAEIFKIRGEALANHDQAVLDALASSASNDSYKHAPDRRVFLEIRGYYTPRQNVNIAPIGGTGEVDYSKISEADLERQARLEAAADD